MKQIPKIKDRHEEINEFIGRVVKKRRRRSGMNQTALAPQLGLDQSALSRVESGKQQLTTTQWVLLCELTGREERLAALTRRYGTMVPMLRRMAVRHQSDEARRNREKEQIKRAAKEAARGEGRATKAARRNTGLTKRVSRGTMKGKR